MSVMETVIAGTLKADGTLELDQRPNLPAGRVTVALRAAPDAVPPSRDPFWQRMQVMWAIPLSSGDVADGGASTLSEIHRMREEWDEHEQAIEGLGAEGKSGGRQFEEPTP